MMMCALPSRPADVSHYRRTRSFEVFDNQVRQTAKPKPRRTNSSSDSIPWRTSSTDNSNNNASSVKGVAGVTLGFQIRSKLSSWKKTSKENISNNNLLHRLLDSRHKKHSNSSSNNNSSSSNNNNSSSNNNDNFLPRLVSESEELTKKCSNLFAKCADKEKTDNSCAVEKNSTRCADNQEKNSTADTESNGTVVVPRCSENSNVNSLLLSDCSNIDGNCNVLQRERENCVSDATTCSENANPHTCLTFPRISRDRLRKGSSVHPLCRGKAIDEDCEDASLSSPPSSSLSSSSPSGRQPPSKQSVDPSPPTTNLNDNLSIVRRRKLGRSVSSDRSLCSRFFGRNCSDPDGKHCGISCTDRTLRGPSLERKFSASASERTLRRSWGDRKFSSASSTSSRANSVDRSCVGEGDEERMRTSFSSFSSYASSSARSMESLSRKSLESLSRTSMTTVEETCERSPCLSSTSSTPFTFPPLSSSHASSSSFSSSPASFSSSCASSVDSPGVFEGRRNSVAVALGPRANQGRLSWPSSPAFSASVDLGTSGTGEGSKPKRRSILRASSLINILSPQKSCNGVGRRSSFKIPNGKCEVPVSPYRPPPPSTPNRRISRTWSDSMATENHNLSRQVIKRQEAVFELFQGEKDMVDDLQNVKNVYRDPMIKLKLVTVDEAFQIFGPIDQLIPIHAKLASKLEAAKIDHSFFGPVGQAILEWVPLLQTYTEFCANQIVAKATLDSKRQEANVHDYLQRCQESSFSRKLDLWAILDGARGRFMKYPLLIRAILKETPQEDEDVTALQEALTRLDNIIKEADHMTGLAECRYFKFRLVTVFEEQCIPEIESSNALICQGTLKNNKNSKLQVFLFDKVVVVTRAVANGYQIFRTPIPVSKLVVEDLADGTIRIGSFRNAFGQGQTSKNLFRISFTDHSLGQSHTLMASDEHAKQKWMRSFQSVTSHIVRVGTANKQ